MLVCVCVSIRACLLSVVRIDIKDRCYLLTVNDKIAEAIFVWTPSPAELKRRVRPRGDGADEAGRTPPPHEAPVEPLLGCRATTPFVSLTRPGQWQERRPSVPRGRRNDSREHIIGSSPPPDTSDPAASSCVPPAGSPLAPDASLLSFSRDDVLASQLALVPRRYLFP